MIRRIVPIVYLLIGLLVASQHSYLTNLTTLNRILSAVLAVVLWPLVLLGIHLNIAWPAPTPSPVPLGRRRCRDS
jgi:hypothetical protein